MLLLYQGLDYKIKGHYSKLKYQDKSANKPKCYLDLIYENKFGPWYGLMKAELCHVNGLVNYLEAGRT